jgi:PhzF family phenazine biosynthesis protein
MNIPVVVYKAFVSDRGGGNPAGIVFSDIPFSKETMQSTARKMALSETVFITPHDKSDYRLRYFTPLQEVPLCGHATIAAWTWLAREKNILPGFYKQETENGPLAIEITGDGDVFMEQALPSFGAEADPEEVADSLGLSRESLHPRYPVQLVSTGLPDILVPLSDTSFLDRIRPDFKKIRSVSEKYNSVGYHVFALDEGAARARCRNFAPAVGIQEEAATGTASGALAAYLYRYRKGSQKKYSFLQGEMMGQPSLIIAELGVNHEKITRVSVGGRAVFDRTCQINI